MKKSLQMAVISGGFALAGALLPQLVGLLQPGRSKNRQRELFLAKKREELSEHLVDSTLRFGDLLQARSLDDLEAQSRNLSAERLHLMCSLYFPALVEPACRYLNAGTGVYLALLDAHDPDDPRSCGAQAVDDTAFKQARAELVQAREAMIGLIRDETLGNHKRTR